MFYSLWMLPWFTVFPFTMKSLEKLYPTLFVPDTLFFYWFFSEIIDPWLKFFDPCFLGRGGSGSDCCSIYSEDGPHFLILRYSPIYFRTLSTLIWSLCSSLYLWLIKSYWSSSWSIFLSWIILYEIISI